MTERQTYRTSHVTDLERDLEKTREQCSDLRQQLSSSLASLEAQGRAADMTRRKANWFKALAMSGFFAGFVASRGFHYLMGGVACDDLGAIAAICDIVASSVIVAFFFYPPWKRMQSGKWWAE